MEGDDAPPGYLEVASEASTARTSSYRDATAAAAPALTTEPAKAKPEETAPPKEEDDVVPPMVAFRELFRFATWGDVLLIIVGSICAFIHGGTMPLFCIAFGDVLEGYGDDAVGASPNGTDTGMIGSDGIDAVKDASLFILYLAVVAGVTAWLQLTCFMLSSQHQGIAIRREYFQALLRQEVGWYDAQLTGQLTSRVAGDVTLIQDATADKLGTVIQFYAMFIVGFVVAFIYSWKLTLVILSLVPALAIGGAIMGKFIAEAQTMGQAEYAEAGGVADEVLTLFRTVVAFGTVDREVARYDTHILAARNRGVKSGVLMGVGMGFTFFIIFCMYSLSFWFGSDQVREGEINKGDVIVAFFAVLIGAMGSGQAAPAVQAILKGRGAAFSVFQVLDRKSKIDSLSEAGQSPSEIKGDIIFEGISFAYPTRKDEPVFTDFDLVIPANTTVAIVGESGCGKSTIANLCLRFYDPGAGSVKLDGVALPDLNVQWLRTKVGLVSQQPMLFPGTIYQNIAAGKMDATQAEVEAAAEQANAHAFIADFPDGYATAVGDSGAQLSGGQKQRIAVARALIKNPRILVLDEATSALDTVSEKLVQDALDKARRSRTTIVIAHRLSTVRDCDSIVVLGDGGIRETGTHDELMAKDGLYASMIFAQRLSEKQSGQAAGDSAAVQGGASGPAAVAAAAAALSAEAAGGKTDTDADDDIDDAEELEAIDMGGSERAWAYALARPERAQIWLGILMCALEAGGYIAWPLFLSRVIVELVTYNRADVIQEWSLAFIGLGVGLFAVIALKMYFLGYAGDSFTRRLRLQSFRQLLSREVGWYDMPGNSKGRLTARLAHDASKIRGLLADAVGALTQLYCMLLIAVGVSMYFCWEIGVVLIGTFPVIGIAAGVQMKMMSGFSEFEDYEASGVYATHAIENIRTVLAMGKVKEYHGMYMGELMKVTPKLARTAHTTGISFGITEFCMIGLWALAFWWGAWVIENGRCDFQDMFDALQCIIFPAMLTGQVMQFMPNIKEAKLSCRRIFQLIGKDGTGHGPAPGADPTAVLTSPQLKGKIEFRDVSFAYPSRPDVKVLDNLSFAVSPGETVALVGASGCGKSTIMALLEQFYHPDSGEVVLDGVPVNLIEPRHFRANIGYVSQEPQLFSMTIRENIAYGIDEADAPSQARIEQAARQANAHEFVSGFEKGYETTVGEKGLKLSGGQRQRVAIARALIRQDAIKILLLDEATSALDTKSEEVVQHELDRLTSSRTTLMIAHRLSTVQNADRILVFDFGRIIEEGTHASLSAAGGAYAKMVATQRTD